MSHLTQSEASLWAAVVSGLEGEGFAFNPLTTSLPAYLATALGEADAYKTKSVAQMLAELNSSFDGEASHLTTSIAALLSMLDTTLSDGEAGPTDILLSEDEVAEDAEVGTVIGMLSTVGGTAPFTYSLVEE